MCEVATIGLVISAVSVGLGAIQTNAQNDATRKGAAIEQDNLNKQTAEIQKQIDSAAQQETSERALAAMRERASLRVAAGEAGVGGTGVAIAEDQAGRNASRDIGIIEANRASRSRQAALDRQGASARIDSRLNELPSTAAVWGQAGLQIAGDYASYAAKRPPRKSTGKAPPKIK